MTIIGFEWNQADDKVNHLNLIQNKTLILHDGEYKKWNDIQPEKEPFIITPRMTNFTTEDCTAFTNSTVFRRPVWEAFDRTVSSSSFFDSGAIKSVDFGVIFTAPKKIERYVIVGYSTVSANGSLMSSWVLQGSNDTTTGLDGTWVNLDIRSGETWTSTLERKEFILEETVEYRAYKFSNAQNKSKANYIYVPDLELYSPAIPMIPSYLQIVSSTLPTSQQFISDGMDSLSPLLDRKITTLEPLPMTDVTSNTLASGEEGKVFSKTLDLKKYLDIRSINVEVK